MIAEAVMCLALNVANEAGIDSKQGQLAVALVTINRAHRNNTSICWETFRTAQFTWTDDPKKRAFLPRGALWKNSLTVAREALQLHKDGHDFTHGATEYHLRTMTPWWAAYMLPAGEWGSHLFYRRVK
jgi:spore germination cell wall hydrolase CwlJ-like protein